MEFLAGYGFPTWVIGVVAVLILLYFYLNKNYTYWELVGIPSTKPYPIIGSFGAFLTQPFHEVEMTRYKKYGRIYGAYEGSNPVLSVAEPDLLRDIFIKDFGIFADRRDLTTGDPIVDNMVSVIRGEHWKRVRTIITPAFTSGKLRKIASIMNDSAKTVVENFTIAAKKGKSVDCKRLFGAFTMDVICSSAFGSKIDSHNDENNPMVVMARKAFSRNFNWRFLMFFIFPKLMKTLNISIFNPNINKFFKDVTIQLVKERRQSGKRREDFLQLLMDAVDQTPIEDPDDSPAEEEEKKVFNQNLKNRNLSEDELVAQCVLFFLAGYETTASTLSFIAYCMAQNPEVQEKFIQEVDKVCAKHKEIDYDVVKTMEYMDRVICETMRIFPPAVRAERQTSEDYKLGDTGITVPKGMIITIPIYGMHYDEDFYPEPEKFDPDRFLPENKSSRNPYTYLPFGHGPRNCLGMRFAQLEMKLCLVQVFRHFRFRVCPETKIPLTYYSGNGLLVPTDITLGVELRTDIPAA